MLYDCISEMAVWIFVRVKDLDWIYSFPSVP